MLLLLCATWGSLFLFPFFNAKGYNLCNLTFVTMSVTGIVSVLRTSCVKSLFYFSSFPVLNCRILGMFYLGLRTFVK